jgi:hypothetical protein
MREVHAGRPDDLQTVVLQGLLANVVVGVRGDLTMTATVEFTDHAGSLVEQVDDPQKVTKRVSKWGVTSWPGHSRVHYPQHAKPGLPRISGACVEQRQGSPGKGDAFPAGVVAHVRHELTKVDEATVQQEVTERDCVLESRGESQPVECRTQWTGDRNIGHQANVVFS